MDGKLEEEWWVKGWRGSGGWKNNKITLNKKLKMSDRRSR